MSALVECVPNFSEGRDKAKIEAIVAAARGVDGVRILDVETDADHNRMVLSFVASPDAAMEAAFRAASKARDLIDLNHHKGEHPRMGATDVVPFIPVSQVSLTDCVEMAKRLGERLGRELEIPVFLYGHAAARPERRDLANVRKGQFEGLKTSIGTDPDRSPDFGPGHIHPTAGATAVGAREQIINFNANLDLTDLEAGKAIAKKIRTSGGGLPELRAKEIALSSGRVQISTVLTNYKVTSIATVRDAVAREAAARGAKIESTEIVGLVPRESLLNFSIESLRVRNFDPKQQVLEEQLERLAREAVGSAQADGSADGWIRAGDVLSAALASTEPTPGGGSAAAMAGAMAAGLGAMAMGVTLKSKKLEETKSPKLEAARQEFARTREHFLRLASEDAAAFDGMMGAYKLPREDSRRSGLIQSTAIRAAEVPLETARTAARMDAELAQAAPSALGSVGSDMLCARHLARAAVECAAENVRINLKSIKDPAESSRLGTELAEILKRLSP